MSLKTMRNNRFRLGRIIDSDYRGNIRVVLHNFSNNRVEFNTSDRIAQIRFEKNESPEFLEVFNFVDVVIEINNKGSGSIGI